MLSASFVPAAGVTLDRVSSTTSINEIPRPRPLRLLVAANGPRDVACAEKIAVRLSKESQITIRAIADDMTHRLVQEIMVFQNRSLRKGASGSSDASSAEEIETCQREACELVEWADLLVLAPIDADSLAKMMCGISDTLLLAVLRGWDASKRILLIPGMATHMWENPVTKRQMSKLHRKWNWIRVMPPILWHYNKEGATSKRVVEWDAFNEVLDIVKNQADVLQLGHNVEAAVQQRTSITNRPRLHSSLPPEIWSIILEYTNDWELATSLGVFTNLPMPVSEGWRLEPKDSNDPLQVFMHELEWTLLTSNTDAICKKLAGAPSSFQDLSALAVHLIFKFSLTDVLSYIESTFPHIFKCFDGKTIPTKASAYYGRTDILDWWARSPSFLEKQYDAEALNLASMRGFVQVLEWWRRSGLPLKYTEAAFELASSKGHLHVLEWWRDAFKEDASIPPKPGRALLAAAQWGQTDVIGWWEESGIPIGHQDGVCKVASRWGQTKVLDLWRELRGDDKIQFDNQILIEATYHAHIPVLEWWHKYAHGKLPGMTEGRRVEYKTMDVEEALEDSLGDQTKVRRWWAENGLNLGLGTSEWMKIRYL
ncbi:flavoprotein [Podospora didyma]|uniref:Flavoprotein n=1 Tax=Podospora didyma TaxID=330526 RepID=A0AAE0NH67_9PEZI|nr:flavoprotein [Podospora didyma]